MSFPKFFFSLYIFCLPLLIAGSEPLPPWEAEKGPEISRLAPVLKSSLRKHWRGQAQMNNAGDFEKLLSDDGVFSDLSNRGSDHALPRIWGLILHKERKGDLDLDSRKQLYKALAYYSGMEAKSPSRWTRGAIEVPQAFLGAWYALEEHVNRDWYDTPELRPVLESIFLNGHRVAAHAWYLPGAVPAVVPADPKVSDFDSGGYYIVANFYPYRAILEYALYTGKDSYLEIIAEVAKRSLTEPVHPEDLDRGFWREGVNMDKVLTAHGQQSYLYGYGRDYLGGMLQLISLFDGGPFAFEPLHVQVITDVVLDAMPWFVYRGQVDYSVLGRHNSTPKAGMGGDKTVLSLTNRLLNLEHFVPYRQNELRELKRRLEAGEEFEGSQYFWNAEDYVHRTKEFSIVVNISSVRSAGPEITDGAGRLNYHFGNGASFIYTQGDEYAKARGGMHFRALPGITAAFEASQPPFIRSWNGLKGKNDFAGGVSNGFSGLCAFESNLNTDYETVTAQKAWFFHGDVMVCLGGNVQSSKEGVEVRSTLNQTEWRSTIKVIEGDDVTLFDKDEKVSYEAQQPNIFVWHDKVGYLVKEGALQIDARTMKTDWPALTTSNRAGVPTDEVDIFNIYINHGSEAYSNYAYAVYPSVEPEAIESLENWEVLSNTAHIQSVYLPDQNWVGAVFYGSGELNAERVKIKTTAPIILMLAQKPEGTWELLFQDPLHRVNPPPVEVQVSLVDDEGAEVLNADVSLDYPQGYKLGMPLKRVLIP